MTTRTDVLIVGAGMSGMAAASELVAKGKSVVVLEGRDRIGGRLYTDRKSGSDIYELGCSWLHESLDNPLLDIALKLGVEVKYDDRNVVTVNDDGPLTPDLELPQAANDFAGFLTLQKENKSLKESIEQFLDTHPMLTHEQKEQLPGLLKVPQLGNGMDWSKVSTKSAPPKGRDLMVVGGFDRILDHVRTNVTDDMIKLGSKVVEVDSSTSDASVTVTTADGTKYTATYVIVTVPSAVLKQGNIQFKPELSAEIRTSLDQISTAKIGKVYLEYGEQWWLDGDKYVYAGKEGPPMLISNWYKYNGGNKHPGLAILVPPPIVEIIESNTASEEDKYKLIKPALDAIRKDKSQQVPVYSKLTTSHWSSDEFALGTFGNFEVTHDDKRPALVSAFNRGANDRVRFAGEHTILNGATMVSGAYRSGLREAQYIANITDGQPVGNAPLP